MSLDKLAARSIGRGWQECGVHYALRVLPNDRATVLLAALDNKPVPSSQIAEALAEEFAHIPELPDASAIGRHRATPRRCKCVDET